MNTFKLRKRGSCLDSYLAPMFQDLQLGPPINKEQEIDPEATGSCSGDSPQDGGRATGTKPKKSNPKWEVSLEIPANIKSGTIINIDFDNPEECYVLPLNQHRKREAQMSDYLALGEAIGIWGESPSGLPERYQQIRTAFV